MTTALKAIKSAPGIVGIPLLLLLFSLVPFSQKAEDRPVAAYVLSVRGDWIADTAPHTLIRKGTSLAPGTQVRPATGAKETDFIVLVDADNRVVQKRCQVDRCEEGVLVAKPVDPSAFSQIIAAVTDLWRSDDKRYRSLLSRGAALQETVLQLKGTRLEVCPVLAATERKQSRVEMVPLRTEGVNDPLDFDVRCDSAQGTGVSPTGMQPGLYSIELLDSGAETHGGPAEKTWVLVARSPDFEQVSRRFIYAQQQTLSWKDTADPTVVRSFLRAYLDYLATNSLGR